MFMPEKGEISLLTYLTVEVEGKSPISARKSRGCRGIAFLRSNRIVVFASLKFKYMNNRITNPLRSNVDFASLKSECMNN